MDQAIVLYNDHVSSVSGFADATNLWVDPKDLPSLNGFTLKPEGACLDDICIPIRDNDPTLLTQQAGSPRFNVAELARRLGQPIVVDTAENLWSFGAIPAVRSRLLDDAIAPDFTLPDRQGHQVTLSKYRDNKVVIMTWASW
jgi:hypothetical protein